jgi:hypothetical protein
MPVTGLVLAPVGHPRERIAGGNFSETFRATSGYHVGAA